MALVQTANTFFESSIICFPIICTNQTHGGHSTYKVARILFYIFLRFCHFHFQNISYYHLITIQLFQNVIFIIVFLPNFRLLNLTCTHSHHGRHVCLHQHTQHQTHFTDIFSCPDFFNMITLTHETFTSKVTAYSRSLCTIIFCRKISSDT